MKYFVICCCILLLRFNGLAQSMDGYSQNETSQSRLMIRYAPGKILKFDPLRTFAGEVVFSLETKVTRKTSLEFELGATISEIPRAFYLYGFVSPGPQDNPISKFGYVGSVAYRYYPLNGGNCKKLYFSPKIRYIAFHYMDEHVHDEVTIGDHHFRGTQMLMNIGWQQWLSLNFALDFYIGSGLGLYNMDRDYTVKTYQEEDQHYSYNTKERNFPLNTGIKVTLVLGRGRKMGGGVSF